MRRIIQFIFGKPDSERKRSLFNYWFGVVIYCFFIVMSFIQCIINGSMISWFTLLLIAIAFPLLFRFVYGVNVVLHKRLKSKNKYIFIIVFASIFVAIFIFVAFSPNSNLTINTYKSEVNGNIHLTIGTLKGTYELEQFSINESGKVSIPYEASVQEGDLLLQVKDSNKTVWEKKISPSDKGTIDWDASKQNYVITINSIKAKKIDVKLSLK